MASKNSLDTARLSLAREAGYFFSGQLSISVHFIGKYNNPHKQTIARSESMVAMNDLTADKKTVLETKRDNPELKPSEIAESIPDDHIKSQYVVRVLEDYSISDLPGESSDESSDDPEESDESPQYQNDALESLYGDATDDDESGGGNSGEWYSDDEESDGDGDEDEDEGEFSDESSDDPEESDDRETVTVHADDLGKLRARCAVCEKEFSGMRSAKAHFTMAGGNHKPSIKEDPSWVVPVGPIGEAWGRLREMVVPDDDGNPTDPPGYTISVLWYLRDNPDATQAEVSDTLDKARTAAMNVLTRFGYGWPERTDAARELLDDAKIQLEGTPPWDRDDDPEESDESEAEAEAEAEANESADAPKTTTPDQDDMTTTTTDTHADDALFVHHDTTKEDIEIGTRYHAAVNNTKQYGVFVSLLLNNDDWKYELNGLIPKHSLSLYHPTEFETWDRVVVEATDRRANGDLDFKLITAPERLQEAADAAEVPESGPSIGPSTPEGGDDEDGDATGSDSPETATDTDAPTDAVAGQDAVGESGAGDTSSTDADAATGGDKPETARGGEAAGDTMPPFVQLTLHPDDLFKLIRTADGAVAREAWNQYHAYMRARGQE